MNQAMSSMEGQNSISQPYYGLAVLTTVAKVAEVSELF